MEGSEVGSVSGIFRAWFEGALGNMAGVVDSVKSWLAEGSGLTNQPTLGLYTMDTLSTLLIGWLFFALLVLTLCKLLFDKYINVGKLIEEEVTQNDEIREFLDYSEIQKSRKPTIVPDECPAAEISNTPVGAGADPDAVRWANNVFTWLYNGNEAAPIFATAWLQELNDFTTKSALEVSRPKRFCKHYFINKNG